MERKTGKNKITELTASLEEGVKALRDSEKFKQFLRIQSRFPRYSVNNCLLIAMQTQGQATAVMSYTGWKAIGRYPREGSHSIKILCPCPYKDKEKDETAEERPVRIGFRIGHVFDISQTDGEPLPEIAKHLEGSVQDYEQLMRAITEVSPVRISFESIPGDANGYYSPAEKRIVIDKSLSEKHRVHTAIHEIGHAVLDMNGTDAKASRSMKETEAESISYVVMNRLLEGQVTPEETGTYSFGYLASWGDEQLSEFRQCLSVIQKTAADLIGKIEYALSEFQEQEPVARTEAAENTREIRVLPDETYAAKSQNNHSGMHM